jgi:hypothetical protein
MYVLFWQIFFEQLSSGSPNRMNLAKEVLEIQDSNPCSVLGLIPLYMLVSNDKTCNWIILNWHDLFSIFFMEWRGRAT